MKSATPVSLFAVLQAPQARGLSAIDKLVLVYLGWRQGRNGTSWPSLRTIERDLQIGRRTCLRSLRRLCESDSIRKIPGQAGRGHSNHYTISVDKRSQDATFLEPEKVAECHLLGAGKGSILTPEKVAECHLNRKGRRRQQARTTFTPPTPEEVDGYAAAIGYVRLNLGRDSVQKYEATGWCIKGGAKMENWKLVVQTWRRMDERNPPGATAGQTKREPQRGDPDWLPSDEEAVATLRECGAEVVE